MQPDRVMVPFGATENLAVAETRPRAPPLKSPFMVRPFWVNVAVAFAPRLVTGCPFIEAEALVAPVRL
jgi:hypothetical protein